MGGAASFGYVANAFVTDKVCRLKAIDLLQPSGSLL